jgi:hypothetical protein
LTIELLSIAINHGPQIGDHVQEEKMVRDRAGAARNVARENLGELMRPGKDRRTAEQLAQVILEGGTPPSGVTPHIRARALDAAREGAEHAYGDNIPADVQARLDQK